MNNKIFIFFFSILILISCKSQNTGRANITFKISQDNYIAKVESEGVVESVRSHVLTSPQVWSMMKIDYIVEEGSKVEKGEIVFNLEAEEIQNDYLTALDARDVTKADAEKKYAELELQRLLYDSQYRNAMAAKKTAELQLTKLEFEPPKIQEIKRLEIKQYELEAERNKKKMESLQKIQDEERAHMNLLIQQAESKISRLEHYLSLLEITSPVDGYIIYEHNRRTHDKVVLGDEIHPGMAVVRIPDMSEMQVNLKLRETDAQRIRKNQKAVITIPTIEDLELIGTVSKVDKMAKSIRWGSKVKRVEVIVKLDSVVQGVVPGLSAFCSIETEKFADAIKVPLECVYEKDSVKLVYVKNNNRFIPQPVAIVNQDNDFAIIEGELKGSENLALVEPPFSNVRWPDKLVAFQSSSPVKSAPPQIEAETVADSLPRPFDRNRRNQRGRMPSN